MLGFPCLCPSSLLSLFILPRYLHTVSCIPKTINSMMTLKFLLPIQLSPSNLQIYTVCISSQMSSKTLKYYIGKIELFIFRTTCSSVCLLYHCKLHNLVATFSTQKHVRYWFLFFSVSHPVTKFFVLPPKDKQSQSLFFIPVTFF